MESPMLRGEVSDESNFHGDGSGTTESSEWTSGTQSSNLYEADFSNYAPTVRWPRRKSQGNASPVPSVYSFHESLDGHLFRDYNGRTYNARNVAYLLPADEEEHRRLDLQHAMIQKYFGALYPAREAVERLLEPRDQDTPMILDIGTGSGAWAIDMSLQFPHCEVIGLDLVPPKIRDAVFPENCRFEIDDGNLSFTHWTNKFDVVHARCINEGIQDFPLFLNHLAQTMKPGAILILGNGTPQFYDEDEQPYQDVNEGEEGFSWLQKWFREVYRLYMKIHSTSLGIDPDDSLYAPLLWDKWARNNPNFVNVNTLDMKLKVGNWSSESSEEIANANELCKLDVLMLIKSYIPLMGSSGYSPEVIEHWSKEAINEVQDCRLKSHGQWKWMWCTRKDCDWVPNVASLPRNDSG